MQIQYPVVIQQVKEWIAREKLKPGAVMPSAREMAIRFGFSHTIALRACHILIADGTLRRDGYKLMVNSESRKAVQIQGPIYILSYGEIFSHVANRIFTEREINHQVVELSYTKHPNLVPVLEKVLLKKPSGILLWTPKLSDREERFLAKTEIPMVVCSVVMHHLKKSTARTDYYRGVEKALKHLHELGHRQIAHISFSIEGGSEEIAEHYRAVCLSLNLKKAASMIWRPKIVTAEAVRAEMLAQKERHPEITAFLCSTMVGSWALDLFEVPKNLSVVGIGRLLDGPESRYELTKVGIRNLDCFAEWACSEIISQLQNRNEGLQPKAANQVMFVPDLVLRSSTRDIGAPIPTPKVDHLDLSPESDPRKTWEKTYPFLGKNESKNWIQLDLAKLANHSMTRHHGWLGAEPLEHFPPGLRSIHGVPFRVLDEGHNGGNSVVTFRSPWTHSVNKKQLPVTAKIRVNCHAKALYFLHGCGGAKPASFAEYILHYKRGDSVSVVLTPLGFSELGVVERLGFEPNIQDWWPSYPQKDFPHAYHVIVFDPAAPAAYERAIYTLQWINPRPDDEISFLQVRVKPKAGPTLSLIAVTALLEGM